MKWNDVTKRTIGAAIDVPREPLEDGIRRLVNEHKAEDLSVLGVLRGKINPSS